MSLALDKGALELALLSIVIVIGYNIAILIVYMYFCIMQHAPYMYLLQPKKTETGEGIHHDTNHRRHNANSAAVHKRGWMLVLVLPPACRCR